MEDGPEGTAGIIPIPCISRKEEADRTAAAVMIVENSPGPKRYPRVSSWLLKSQSRNLRVSKSDTCKKIHSHLIESLPETAHVEVFIVPGSTRMPLLFQ